MGWIARAAAALACSAFGLPAAWAGVPQADFRGQDISVDAQYVAHWAVSTGDHRGLPFAVVDKREARIYVFENGGRLSGASTALLGQAIGDASAPDVGAHTQAGEVPLHERTTPAGRFLTVPGVNLAGEHVVWVDYQSAFAIHRVRPGKGERARQARLASATPGDNRVSLGCVVVPVAFYEHFVQRLLGKGRAVVYVLPETRAVREVFGDL
ncbi:MAG: L,D-transpeptidase [Ramlibacter sp.]|nr:L,D-transpeptidase [Ramlibacter sp.]